MRNAGYASCLIGQWHPGLGDGCHANGRRIDGFCGMQVGSHGDFPSPQKNPLERNGEPLMEFSSPCLIDFFTDEALQQRQGCGGCRDSQRTLPGDQDCF